MDSTFIKPRKATHLHLPDLARRGRLFAAWALGDRVMMGDLAPNIPLEHIPRHLQPTPNKRKSFINCWLDRDMLEISEIFVENSRGGRVKGQ